MSHRMVAFLGFFSFLFSFFVGNALGAVHYEVTDLGTLGGTWSRAFSINDAGQVVGLAQTSGDTVSQAFLYSGSGPMQDIGIPSGFNSSYAEGINNKGQVIGVASSNLGSERAFLYSGIGQVQDLGTLGGSNGSSPSGINDVGQITGFSSTIDNNQRISFQWQRSDAGPGDAWR